MREIMSAKNFESSLTTNIGRKNVAHFIIKTSIESQTDFLHENVQQRRSYEQMEKIPALIAPSIGKKCPNGTYIEHNVCKTWDEDINGSFGCVKTRNKYTGLVTSRIT